MSRERPIIFGAESVCAILAGQKTQTRRVLGAWASDIRWFGWPCDADPGWADPQRRCSAPSEHEFHWPRDNGFHWHNEECPYGVPGDRLWVRETWAMRHEADGLTPAKAVVSWGAEWYCADQPERFHRPGRGRWRPPRFMPRWASRLLLEITAVRVERLHAITEEDARAEGVSPELESASTHVLGFKHGWDALNARRGFPWESNPWVFAISFKRVDADEALAARLRAMRGAQRAAEEATDAA